MSNVGSTLRIIIFGLAIVFVPPNLGFTQNQKQDRPLQATIFGSWSLVCPSKGSQGLGCHISQSVATDPQGKKVLLGISISLVGTPQKTRIAFRLTPTAVVDAGIGLKIDNGDEFRLPISHCDARICAASGLLDDKLMARLKKGTLCQFAYMLPNRKQVTLPVSLMGFSEAYSSLTQRVKAER